jgi:hypothetical protein
MMILFGDLDILSQIIEFFLLIKCYELNLRKVSPQKNSKKTQISSRMSRFTRDGAIQSLPKFAKQI